MIIILLQAFSALRNRDLYAAIIPPKNCTKAIIANPNIPQVFSAVRINSLDGKPLMFQSINDCDQHVQENINPLKRYAISVYSAADPLVRVKDILCVEVRGVGV